MSSLSGLYHSKTPLSEVHPEFRGIPIRNWKMLKIQEQSNELVQTWKPENTKFEYGPEWQGDQDPRWAKNKPEWRARDSYGMKSV